MRLNKFLAHNSGISRRAADEAIEQGQVTVNNQPARLGMNVEDTDLVTLNGQSIAQLHYTYILLDKPVGYFYQKGAQNAPTLYELLPGQYQNLKTVGRLDKNTSGLILLSDDGDWAFEMTHPKFSKSKRYIVRLDAQLTDKNLSALDKGIELEDGLSRLKIRPIEDNSYRIDMTEGRNRQIRRTFEAIGRKVFQLHRTDFGPYSESDLSGSMYAEVNKRT